MCMNLFHIYSNDKIETILYTFIKIDSIRVPFPLLSSILMFCGLKNYWTWVMPAPGFSEQSSSTIIEPW